MPLPDTLIRILALVAGSGTVGFAAASLAGGGPRVLPPALAWLAMAIGTACTFACLRFYRRPVRPLDRQINAALDDYVARRSELREAGLQMVHDTPADLVNDLEALSGGLVVRVGLADVLEVFQDGETALDHETITQRLKAAGVLRPGFTSVWVRECIEAAGVPYTRGELPPGDVLRPHVYQRADIQAAVDSAERS